MWGWPREFPTWNWKGNEGKPLLVRVFTKASHLKLELNGKIVGEKDLAQGDKYIAVFEVPYQPGELKATAYDNEKEIATKILSTSGSPSAIRLVADRNEINNDRNDLSFVKIEVVDASGKIVTQDPVKIRLTISDNGEIAASGNADPKDMASVNRLLINTYQGKALAVIRSNGSGIVRLKAESQGLKTGELNIPISSLQPGRP
jgi:beta-galactosidase